MAGFLQSDLLPEVLQRLEEASVEARGKLSGLGSEELNWKPSAKAWSVAECLEHLVATHDAYWPQIQRVIGSTAPRAPDGNRIRPTLIGKMLFRAVDPDSTTRTKAPGVFRPERSHVEGSPLEAFLRCQANLRQLVEGTSDVDWHRVRLSTPVNRAIRLRLGDAYRVLAAHSQRHVNQAVRVTRMDGFPRQAGDEATA